MNELLTQFSSTLDYTTDILAPVAKSMWKQNSWMSCASTIRIVPHGFHEGGRKTKRDEKMLRT